MHKDFTCKPKTRENHIILSYIKPRLHSFDLWAPTQRSLQTSNFTNTNWKEKTTPWFIGSNLKEAPTPYLHHPATLICMRLSTYHCHYHLILETVIHKLHLKTLRWNTSPLNPRSNKTSFTSPYRERNLHKTSLYLCCQINTIEQEITNQIQEITKLECTRIND